jgi:uncharacterized repeat protein (TIGR01451 family)
MTLSLRLALPFVCMFSAGLSAAETLVVRGTAVIFVAGRTNFRPAPPGAPPANYILTRNNPPGPYAETLPVSLAAGAGEVFEFNATGGVQYDCTCNCAFFPTDGDPSSYATIDGLGGISGYHGPIGALLGVFWDASDSADSIAPPTIDFTRAGATSATNFRPLLGQVFFIGDGLTGTGSGATQKFVAPNGATGLYFGYADALDFSGPPGNYDDNTGSNLVFVTRIDPPVILSEPTNLVVKACGIATFAVTASGTPPLSYQWFFDQTNVLTGATNATLALPDVQTNQAGFYGVVVTDVAGSATSSNALLTVLVPPAITQQPQSQTVNLGADVTFTVTAVGTAPLLYQWQLDGTSLAGATNATLTLANVETNEAGNYGVSLSNVAGSTSSSNALLTVLVPPSILSQPTNQTVISGATASFQVVASGSSPLTYQWFFNQTTVLPRTANATLTLTNAQPGSAGGYSVVVSDSAGETTSTTAFLTVVGPPTITQPPANVLTNQGANVVFSVTATGAVFSVAATGNPPLSYQWLFNQTNLQAGATDATLALANVQPSDAGWYSVLVSDSAGVTASAAVSLTIFAPPSITQEPASVTTNQGANVAFSVVATGAVFSVVGTASPPLGYQWLFDQTNLLAGGTNAVLTLTNVQPAAAGRYSVLVRNLAGQTGSTAASLTVVPVPVLGVSLIAPTNGAAVCYGNAVALAASVTANQPVVSVSYYAGATLLGSNSSPPYQYTWTPGQPGTYRLSAQVADIQGRTALSTQGVSVVVSPDCLPVAVIRAAPDPEIDALQEYLLEMGLGSVVFDQAGLSSNLLAGFRLVIWDDVGLANALATNTVDALAEVCAGHVPVYLIGGHLVSAGTSLPAREQAEWVGLTHLGAGPGGICDGPITIIDPEGPSNPILWGQFATVVDDMLYTNGIEMATNDPSSELLCQCNGASALVIYPPLQSPGQGPTNLVVQDFRVLPPGAPAASANLLGGLFKNAVCWLIGCGNCEDAGLDLQGTQTNDVVMSGQVMTYALTASCSGECPPLDVRITNWLPAGFVFLGATNQQGSWICDTNNQEVIFSLGQMYQGSPVQLTVTVAPTEVGTYTNAAQICYSLSPTSTLCRDLYTPLGMPLVTTVVPSTNPPAKLSLRPLSPTDFELSLTGQAGQLFQIRQSTDLLHWSAFTNVLGPTWTYDFTPPPATNRPGQFFGTSPQ